MPSHVFWDSAFILGLLIQTTKLADLILRPKQQEWVRNICESATLRLEYLRPLTWFGEIQNHKVQNFLVAQTAIIGIAFDASLKHFPFELTILYFWFTCIPALFVLHTRGLPLVRWIYASGEFRSFIWRYFQFFLVGGGVKIFIAMLSAYLAELIPLNLDPGNPLHVGALGIVMLFVFGPIAVLSICIWIILVMGLLAIFGQLILFGLAALIVPFRAIAWRVVEYNKGPWAALTLLATACVGAVDLYLHTAHQH